MSKFLTYEGLETVLTKVKGETDKKVEKVTGKDLSTNDYTTTEKTKLAGIATGAEVNQNAFTTVVAGGTSVVADAKSDTLTIEGSNITITGDATNDKVTITHPTSGATAGTYKSVTVDARGHVTTGTNPTTLAGYGITDAAAKTHQHGNADITDVDASKIKSGTIDIERLPAGALERCVVVATDTARLALTTSSVQTGDTVKVTATGLMYFVVDDTKLSTEAGYEVYTAGSATSVPWSGITDKPSTYTPATHTHTKSQITDFPTTLPNANALTIKAGSKTVTYTGSAVGSIEITASDLGALTAVEEITTTEISSLFTNIFG